MDPIEKQYFVLATDYDVVDYVINFEDERSLDIKLDRELVFEKAAQFECLDFASLVKKEVNFDISIDCEMLFSTKYQELFNNGGFHKTSVVPANVGHKPYLYIHCYNIIECIEAETLNLEKLNNIPLDKRLIFKPSIGSLHTYFHKDVVEKLQAICPPKDVRIIELSNWSPKCEFS
ncbi:hypothetical protein [uncultured Photobacterium sp.]|uniref:hypothetical protein n=1 Tax=uncultured Photobacterium sp. TaxID=173973 RepID=UPI002620ECF2|nr:hypothetical protein [uncultured Photobacterium sp.]